jgi:hypothetical protein
LSGNQWIFSGSSDTLDGFTRHVTLSDIDSNTKNAQVLVTWAKDSTRTGQVTLATLLTNWRAATGGYWASVSEESFEDVAGSQDGLKIQVVGTYAYITTNENNSEFAILSIADTSNPVYLSGLNLGGSGLTNIAVVGNYAYFSTQNNAKELQIVDVTNPSNPTPSGVYNAPGTADGVGIYVSGTKAYLIRLVSSDPELYIIDVSNPALPAFLGSMNLSGEPTDIYVKGNFAYIASKDDTSELQVIDVSIPVSPQLEDPINISGSEDASSVMGVGALLGLGRTDHRLYLYDISADPDEPELQSSMLLDGDVVDLTFAVSAVNSRTYGFAVTQNGSSEIPILDVTSPASPVLDGKVIATDIFNGVAYSASHDRVVGVGSSNNKEFVIYSP